jgi:predicted ester cyclase
MSIEEENKAIVQRFAEEVLQKHNLSIIDEIISEEYVLHGPGGQEIKGPEGFKQLAAIALTGFSDGLFTIDGIVAEGDTVAVRYTRTGTHDGEYHGIAPTGKQIKVPVAFFYRLADGKIIDAVGYSDSLILLQQLGVTPPSQ